MPMLQWSAPAGGPHGVPIDIRCQGGEVVYTLVDAVPTFVEPTHVAAVTAAITTAIPGATITTPAAAQ